MPGAPAHGGGRWRDHRQVVNGLFWKLVTGAQWRGERCVGWLKGCRSIGTRHDKLAFPRRYPRLLGPSGRT